MTQEEHFYPAVKYHDWEGKVAADSSDTSSVNALLKQQGKGLSEGDVVVGIRFWLGELFARMTAPSVHGYVSRIKEVLSTDRSSESDTLQVRRIRLSLSAEEFLLLFKRLSINLERSGTSVIGKTLTMVESED